MAAVESSVVRAPAPLVRLERPRADPELVQLGAGPRRAFTRDRLGQRRVGAVDVVTAERWRLVDDLMGIERCRHRPRD